MSEQTLFRLRVRYGKLGRLKHLGHLEVIHTIERIIRRARMPYAVTQGYSPHMRIGFSAALPVGTSSTCEWYDLFLTEYIPADAALKRLAAASPADLAPVAAGYVDVRAPALTAFLTSQLYRIHLEAGEGVGLDAEALRAALDAVRAGGTVPYLRGKKSKVLDLDRTLVAYELRALPHGAFELVLDTHADNDGAMRPEILLAAIDRVLCANPEAEIVSTGIQDLTGIARYTVERFDQFGCDDTGARLEALPAHAEHL